MKLAINTMSLKRLLKQRDNDPLRVLNELMEFPINGIELFDAHAKKNIKQFVAAANDRGLEVSSLAIHNAYHVSGSRALKMRTYVKDWFQIAIEAGIHTIRTFIDDLMRPGISLVFRTKKMREAALARVLPMIRETVELARDQGITIGIENHHGFSSDPEFISRVDALMQEIGMCGWVFDAGNWPPSVDRYAILERVLPRVVYVHGKSKAFVSENQVKGIDYARIIQILKNAGYKGYISVEYEGLINEKEGVTRTIADFEKHVQFEEKGE